MAKKKAPPKKAILTAPPTLALVAPVGAALTPANINIVFTSGVGQVTCTLFRNGAMINMQSVSSSSTIFFSDVQSRDGISVNGVCAGTATITVSVPTTPTTPKNFTAGPIHTILIVR